MPVLKKRDFDPGEFLATIGEGRKAVVFSKKQTIFAQGDAADAVFYIQEGKVRLTVVSEIGKEATLGILDEGSFSEKVPSRTTLAHGFSHRHDGLRSSAD